MALIKCLNCGHNISDKAEYCPKCGMMNLPYDEFVARTSPPAIDSQPDPIDVQIADSWNDSWGDSTERFDGQDSPKARKISISTIIIMRIGVLVIVVLVIYLIFFFKPNV